MNAFSTYLLAALLIGQPTPAPELTGPEWRGYKGDAGLTGLATDDAVKPPFKLAWSYRLDGDASSDGGGGVIVAAGKVFVSVFNTRSVLALDARDGRFLWETKNIGGGIRTVPTFAEDRLHLLVRDGGVSKPKTVSVLVLDAATGKELWKHSLSAEGVDPHRSGLPVVEGKLYCSEGGPSPGVIAFDARTGQRLWRSELGADDGTSTITPIAAGGRVFVATRSSHHLIATEGATFALDAGSGKILWKRKGVFPWVSLTSDGKIVTCGAFRSEDEKFTVLDAATGKTLWQAPKRFHYSPATIAKDLILIKPYGSDFIAVDRETGKERWQFKGHCSSGCCSPIVCGDYAYMGTGVPATGDLENLPTFQYGKSPPREEGRTGTLHAVDLKTGKSVWSFSTGNTICGEPAPAYGRLYFHSRDGNVYCFVPAKEGDPTTPEAIERTEPVAPAVVAKLLTPERMDRPRPGRDWPMLGGGPDRAGIENVALAPNLELAWKLNAGGRIVGAAAIRDGKAFVGSDAGKIFAVDLMSGKPAWEFGTGAAVRCSPAVVDGLVYCGSDSGAFVALDQGTGEKRWSFKAGGPVRGSPVVAGGIVLFGADDHNLYALDSRTGAKLWSFRAGDYCVSIPPVVHGDRVYCAQWTEWVYALDLKTGKKQWRSYIPLSVEGLSFYRDRLWARNLHYLVELDPATGNRLRLADASWGWGGMAFQKSKVFVSGIRSQYGTNGAVSADLDQEGKDIAKIPTLENVKRLASKSLLDAPALAAMGTPLAVGDRLCFATVSGKLVLTDPDGTQRWTFDLGDTCHATPVAADGVLVVGCDDGFLYAFKNQPPAPLKIHMIGHGEYSPEESLTSLKKHLEKHFRVECTMSLKLDKNRLDNLESLKNADVLVLLARRMNLAKDQMEIIRNHWESGKPIVGIRTASHAFQKDDNEVLDKKVFGGNYTGTDGGKFTLAAGAADHPVLKGVQPFRVGTYLYQQGKLADDAVILQLQGNTPQTWVHTYKGGRMLYTSGGAVADFGNENFLRLLSNAIFWTTHRDPEKMMK